MAPSSCPVLFPLHLAAHQRCCPGEGGHLWAGTKLSRSPWTRRRTGAHARTPAGGWQTRAASEAGPHPHRGFRPRGFHSNGCAGRGPPRDAPWVRGHLCSNGNLPRYGGSDGPLPPHCVAEPPTLGGGERRVAGMWGSGRGSQQRKATRRPRAPSLQGSVRQARGPTPGSRSEPQRWPALGWQKTVHAPLAAQEGGGSVPIVASCQTSCP